MYNTPIIPELRIIVKSWSVNRKNTTQTGGAIFTISNGISIDQIHTVCTQLPT